MFIKMPVVWRMVYGIPTQMLTTMMITLVRRALFVVSVPKPSLRPKASKNQEPKAPESESIKDKPMREMNCGTAMERVKMKRQNFLNLMPSLLIINA